MSRPIKLRAWDKQRVLRFRVWDITERRWGSFDAFIGDGYTDLNDKRDDVIITQFTDLLDSKGREIYEGDILLDTSSYYSTPRANEVKWISTAQGWGIDGWHGIPSDISAREVIGNIFEHSHLLK